ncbi:Barstar (Barnase inhibitor) superfamily protein [Actibacterium atlanticum]|uniref:Barstar (Barnase inhibitor) superfamily protein n=1 Tax=Actibacterium atlanticum TaxID=1461693 RepID=A0A058ZIU3_9RHOB|nr:barstar family protein [Actibacterium atlanticum]KCV81135.1 Barstar (Barnase inhibitor) superfamily protein [Actibacterium atlanticum]
MNHVVEIDCQKVRDWDSFHDVFSSAFGFPAFYGRNMNAWHDCMSSLDDGFCVFEALPTDTVTITLKHADFLKTRAPELLTAVHEGVAFVNSRRMENREMPMLLLAIN